ncbi:aliphatic sulfonate ABC transporter substrate-binding protein [Paenibacillus sp. LMG 31458]|uniref:Aliphatic sulfonate ABC transporter substrate-binding protein n=1 Tax=Paenibacillus phytorum TaxID=2654977 RepID=A0ABX1XPR2_9BACL|nr:aliphatic sulfonate ABC transporter substrate-binding protein [Paenibacillus phytorum]NOU70379.1 aliphatic sulfonate ABC transporter substrate-binding protein [Paenibacillus phytorum]
MVAQFKSLSKLTVTSALFSVTILLSACGSGSSPTNAGNATQTPAAPATSAVSTPTPKTEVKMETINFAYMPNMGGAAPVALGEDKGFFKEQGIKLNPVKFLSGPPEFQAMASGDIDIAYIGPGATFLAAQGQGNIIGLVSLGKADMVLATKKSGVKEWKDLKGKTVGVPKGTSGEMVLNLGLEKGGLKPTEVNMVNMDVAGAVSAYVAGKVDAVAIWSPYTVEIEKQVGKENIVKLGDNSSFYPDYSFPSSWVASPKFLKEKPELAERFMKAMNKTTDYKISHLDEAVKLTAAYTQVPEDSLKEELNSIDWIDSKKQAEVFKDGSAKKWFDNLQKLFVDTGKVTSTVPSEKFMTTEPAIKAVQP